jgi:hypothetical protein
VSFVKSIFESVYFFLNNPVLVFGVIVNCSQYPADTEEQWKCSSHSGYSRTCSRVSTHVGSTLAQQGLRSAGIFTGIAQQCELQRCGVCKVSGIHSYSLNMHLFFLWVTMDLNTDL